jgi:beta-phosphoglucomutase-like phosphatase (HAD superfamily)
MPQNCSVKAARQLGMEPKQSVVVEDAVAGVAVAKSAGLLFAALTNTHPRGCCLP